MLARAIQLRLGISPIAQVRESKHGARSTKQAIAIGLSKARRAGVKLPVKQGVSARTRVRRG